MRNAQLADFTIAFYFVLKALNGFSTSNRAERDAVDRDEQLVARHMGTSPTHIAGRVPDDLVAHALERAGQGQPG